MRNFTQVSRELRTLLNEKMSFMKTINGAYNEEQTLKIKEFRSKQLKLETESKSLPKEELTKSELLNLHYS